METRGQPLRGPLANQPFRFFNPGPIGYPNLQLSRKAASRPVFDQSAPASHLPNPRRIVHNVKLPRAVQASLLEIAGPVAFIDSR